MKEEERARLEGLAVRRASLCVRLARLQLSGEATAQEHEEHALFLMGASNQELKEMAAGFGIEVEAPPDPASERLVNQYLGEPLRSPEKLARMIAASLRDLFGAKPAV